MELKALFTPVVAEQEADPNFVRALQTCLKNRKFAEEFKKWVVDFQSRDGESKFIRQFQTTFNACLWEIYLNRMLHLIGINCDQSKDRPDFVFTDHQIVMEAVIAREPQGGEPEHRGTKLSDVEDLNILNKRMMIRSANSIDSKSKKYLNSYQSLAHVQGKSFVIALAMFDGPGFRLGLHRPIEALLYGYYFDEEKFTKGGYAQEECTSHISHVMKNESVSIPMGIFEDQKNAHISAVLINPQATLGKVAAVGKACDEKFKVLTLRYNSAGHEPKRKISLASEYHESMQDGTIVFHNPFATTPMDLSVFRKNDICQSYYQEGQRVYDNRDNHLDFRLLRRSEDFPED